MVTAFTDLSLIMLNVDRPNAQSQNLSDNKEYKI